MMKSPSSSPADPGGGGDAVKAEDNIDVDEVAIKEEPRSDPLERVSPACGGEDLVQTDDVKVKEEPIDLDEPEFIPEETMVKTEDTLLETPVTIKCESQDFLKDETEDNPFPDFDPEDEEAYQDFLEDSGGPSDPGQISTDSIVDTTEDRLRQNWKLIEEALIWTLEKGKADIMLPYSGNVVTSTSTRANRDLNRRAVNPLKPPAGESSLQTAASRRLREEKRKANRERKRKHMERLKQNPKQYAKYLECERLRSKARRESGQLKKIQHLCQKEREAMRERWRKASRESYEKKRRSVKFYNLIDSPSSEDEGIDVPDGGASASGKPSSSPLSTGNSTVGHSEDIKRMQASETKRTQMEGWKQDEDEERQRSKARRDLGKIKNIEQISQKERKAVREKRAKAEHDFRERKRRSAQSYCPLDEDEGPDGNKPAPISEKPSTSKCSSGTGGASRQSAEEQKQGRERKKRYMERLKQDPDQCAKFKENERQRSKARGDSGKIKRIEQMSRKEREAVREKRAKYQRDYRERKRRLAQLRCLLDSQSHEDEGMGGPDGSGPTPTRQKLSTSKSSSGSGGALRQSTEEKRKQARERKRRQLERLKQDPDQCAKFKEKERLRSKARRDSGKIKRIEQMSQKERKAVREKWRKASRESYEKKRRSDQFYNLIDSPSSEDEGIDAPDGAASVSGKPSSSPPSTGSGTLGQSADIRRTQTIETERRQMERLKQDPDQCDNFEEEERRRSKARRDLGKIKRIEQIIQKERNALREKRAKAEYDFRERKRSAQFYCLDSQSYDDEGAEGPDENGPAPISENPSTSKTSSGTGGASWRTTEEKRKQARERKRRHLERLKQDPDQCAKFKEKERLRSKARRDSGQIKKIEQMSQKERKAVREKWAKYQRDYKERKMRLVQ